MLHHLSSLSGHHKESGSLEPSRGQSQQFSCYKAVFSFFLWQHYHGILAWGEWTYSDRCLDLKRENDHKYRNTLITHRKLWPQDVTGQWEWLTWVCCGQHPLRFLCSPCFFSWAECRAGWWTALHLWVLYMIFPSWASHLTWWTGPWPTPPWRWTSWRRSSSRQPPQGLLWNEQFSLFCLLCF